MSTAVGQRNKRKFRAGKDESSSTEPIKASSAEEGPVASTSKLSRGNGIGVGVGVGVGVGRVTRRSVANASVGVKGGVREEVQAEAGPSNAPEQDIVSKSTKRPRKSRTSHTPPPAAQILPSTKEHHPSTNPISLLRRHLPYPIGLTPYRYTCLHPHLPPPPPGDPLDPNWKPYDPNHVSHLGPLPDSVRALSALGQDRPMVRPRGLRTSIGDDKDIDPSLQGPGGLGTFSGGIQTSGEMQKKREGDIPNVPYYPLGPLDPSLDSLSHPPIPQSQPGPGISNGDTQPQSQSQPHRPVDPSDPGFDINTFLESATYESLTALLAAGDDVGGSSTNG